jgi:protein SCO1
MSNLSLVREVCVINRLWIVNMFIFTYLARFCRVCLPHLWISGSLFVLCHLNAQRAYAIDNPGVALGSEAGVFTVLGTNVDLNREFTDHTGRTGKLSGFLTAGVPTIIVPVYYRCPRLCGLVLEGVFSLLNDLPLLLGKDFSVVAVSFNNKERFEEGRETREKFLARLKTKEGADSNALRFLVGADESVNGLMGELGFKFLPDGDDFAHSAAVMILTPLGEISQYFTGIEFSPWDVRLALVEASNGRIGNAIDHFLLYCFRFDSLKGKYTWAVTSVLRIGGALTLLLLGVVLWFVTRTKRNKGGAIQNL